MLQVPTQAARLLTQEEERRCAPARLIEDERLADDHAAAEWLEPLLVLGVLRLADSGRVILDQQVLLERDARPAG